LFDVNYPGTAFTRSLGNRTDESIGVIYIMEITMLDLMGDDRFFVLTSDGVFNFPSSQGVIDMGSLKIYKFVVNGFKFEKLRYLST
jgi:serine/threonine protein phosphatase PrpC